MHPQFLHLSLCTSAVLCCLVAVLCVCRELEVAKEALQLMVTEVTGENERLKSRLRELEERVRVYLGGERPGNYFSTCRELLQ